MNADERRALLSPIAQQDPTLLESWLRGDLGYEDVLEEAVKDELVTEQEAERIRPVFWELGLRALVADMLRDHLAEGVRCQEFVSLILEGAVRGEGVTRVTITRDDDDQEEFAVETIYLWDGRAAQSTNGQAPRWGKETGGLEIEIDGVIYDIKGERKDAKAA